MLARDANCRGHGSGLADKCVDELLYLGNRTLHLGRRNVGRQGVRVRVQHDTSKQAQTLQNWLESQFACRVPPRGPIFDRLEQNLGLHVLGVLLKSNRDPVVLAAATKRGFEGLPRVVRAGLDVVDGEQMLGICKVLLCRAIRRWPRSSLGKGGARKLPRRRPGSPQRLGLRQQETAPESTKPIRSCRQKRHRPGRTRHLCWRTYSCSRPASRVWAAVSPRRPYATRERSTTCQRRFRHRRAGSCRRTRWPAVPARGMRESPSASTP